MMRRGSPTILMGSLTTRASIALVDILRMIRNVIIATFNEVVKPNPGYFAAVISSALGPVAATKAVAQVA